MGHRYRRRNDRAPGSQHGTGTLMPALGGDLPSHWLLPPRRRAGDRRPPPHLRGVGRVWALSGAMAVTAAFVFLTSARHLELVDSPRRLPWWALAVLFYVAEAIVLRVHFKREAQEFALSEIPLVLGLFLSSPTELLSALLVGSTAALALHRRQSRLQLAFNVSHFALATMLAVLIVDHVVVTDPLGPEGWFGAVLSTVVTTLLGHAAITAATVLSGGQPEVGRLPRVLAFGFAATLVNSSLALSAVAMMWRDLSTGWLLVVPAAALVFFYKAWMAERHKHEAMELIYESTRMLHRSPEVDSAVLGLLDQAREIFRAERAEITVFPVNEGEKAVRTSLGPRDAVESMARVDLDPEERAWAMTSHDNQAVLYPDPARSGSVVTPLAARGVRQAMVKVVRSDDRVVGTIMVANGVGEARDSHFLAADLLLFETLAHNIGLALENGRLEQSLAQLRELENQLKYQAYHDPLTHLANRALFLERLGQALGGRDNPTDHLAVVFIDLDDFKTVNDSLGHAVGDQLLITASRRIKAMVRPQDVTARLGSDEFAVLLEDMAEPDDAIRVAQRIIEAVRAPMAVHDQEAKLSVSVGIALGSCGRSPEELLRNAGVAMSTAKERSKGRYEVFEPGMHLAIVERHELMADLHRAVERDEFVLHFQPILELATGRVVALESLVRWRHPRKGLVLPSDFIPLAEETGLILAAGRIVLQKACAQAREWRERFSHIPGLAITVNLSGRQLQQPGFVGEVMQVIAESGVEPEALILEITETVLMQDTEGIISKLMQLKKLGVRLAMDDFGTGYSSLSSLARLPLDTLKLAKPFVDGLGRDDKATAFAHAIVRLGQTVQLQLIAEGIERPDQLAELRAMGCDMGQGYLFGLPRDARGTEDLLREGLPGDGHGEPGGGRIIPFPA